MKFGEYELLDRIAVGGMAEIHRGRAMGEEGFEKLVAIKRILPSYARDATFVNMLLTEARIHASLSHRNIVQIHDLGVSDEGEYFIVLEYVDGPDLGAVLNKLAQLGAAGARPSRVPDAVALHIVMELGEGAHFAHEQRGPDGQPLGLIHRDISPSNVLLSYAGEVKLSDFGLAKRRTDHSVVGSLKGKLAYMSPEQARRVPLDRRSDVFSLGAVLFELVTGRRLRDIADEVSGWQQVASGLVPAVRRYRPDVPPVLERVLAGALAPDPRDRFPDARALVEAGRAALDLLPRSRMGEAAELQALLKEVLPPGSPRPRGAPSKVIRLMSEMQARATTDDFSDATVVNRAAGAPAATMAATRVAKWPSAPAGDAASMAVTRVAPYPAAEGGDPGDTRIARPPGLRPGSESLLPTRDSQAPVAPPRPASPPPMTLYSRPAPTPDPGAPRPGESSRRPTPASLPAARPVTSTGLPAVAPRGSSSGPPAPGGAPAVSPRTGTALGLPTVSPGMMAPQAPAPARSTPAAGLPVSGNRPVPRPITGANLPVVDRPGAGALPLGPPRHTPSGGVPSLPPPTGSTGPRRPTPATLMAPRRTTSDLAVVGARTGPEEELATTTLRKGSRPAPARRSLLPPLLLGGMTGLGAVVAGVHFLLVPLPVLVVWRQPARLDVRSEPSGAEVYLDGRRLSALTPTYTEVRRDRRRHTLELRKEGFQSVRQSLRYDQTEALRFAITLERSARPGVEPLATLPAGATTTAPDPAASPPAAPGEDRSGAGAPAPAMMQVATPPAAIPNAQPPGR